MTRKDVLKEAEKCVCENRYDQYGDIEDNFSMIAKLWTAYTCERITETDVAAMMCLLKIARVKTGSGVKDNWVDLAGYAACGGELDECD